MKRVASYIIGASLFLSYVMPVLAVDPAQGPGGPILVVTSSANPFNTYYAEILRAEGLNEFTTADISTVTVALLQTYDVVLLGEMPLSLAQVTIFSDWVTGGGNLIAMRPDKQLSGFLGISDAAATLSNAYLLVDTATPPGAGIVNQTIQYHGTADLYTLSGATAVATLYSNATTSAGKPAVTLRSVGASGGQAAAFTYDLAHSVILSRQGNSAWNGQERDGVVPVRPDDLFFGAASGDVQPDWIDLNKVSIPQADEQQRLLANLILQMNLDKKPLPRFWYLPKGLKAAVVMTGDDHGIGGTASRFNQFISASPANCSVADWECIRGTSYIYESTPLTNAQAVSYHNQGFEVAVHVHTNCADWTPSSLASFYSTQLSDWAAKYTGLPSPSTVRTHCISWSDYATQPQVELNNGIRLDTNYYYWGPSGWIQNRPGFFTASGFPQRFVDLAGNMIDVYQATTQMTDESDQTYPFTVDTLLDNALGAAGYYGAFVVNAHTDQPTSSVSDAVVNSAKNRNVPVISSKQLLDWTDGRNASSFGSFSWNGTVLGFSVTADANARNIQAMVPTLAPVGVLTGITRGGTPIEYTTQTIKGIEYAFFPSTTGNYQATYAVDTTPPVISGVSVAPLPTTATVTWTTNEPATSHVDYGVSASSLSQNMNDAALVTSHTPVLTGLSPGTTYYYRVTSVDAAGNSVTSPVTADPPASFSTPAPFLTDTTVADFTAGTLDANTAVTQTTGGEVGLRPTEGSEFDGSALPAGWFGTPWESGGNAVISGGAVTADGILVGTNTYYSAGRSIEFSGTFTGAPWQHIGFGVDFNGSSSHAIFSTEAGGGFFARTSNGAQSNSTALNGGLLGGFHRYRIDWNANNVVYFVDGIQVASQPITIGTQLRPLISDATVGGGATVVDWMRMTPYNTPATFLSRVFDAGQTTAWGNFSWLNDLPSGASLTMSVRTGSTPIPDGTWTTFTSIPASGSPVNASSRYLQYQAQLSTTTVSNSPALTSATIEYATGPDTTPPDTTITASPSNPSNNPNPSFSFTSTEAGSTFECALDGAAFSACTSPKAYTGLADGGHTFLVKATDGAGNTDATPAGVSWTVDTIAPDTTITSSPSDPGTSSDATFTFTATESGSTFQCTLDGAAFTSCTSPKNYTGLGNGNHTFQVKAADAAGNSDATPASFSWTITIPDTTPPDTTITASPSNPSNNPNPSFSFTSTEGSSTFECSLDGAAFVSCVSPQSYTGLADGSHTFQVKATDAAGNVDASPASTTWTIDTLAPDTTITSGPSDPSTSGTASFIFSATESGSTFQCTLDGAAFTSCTSPKNYTGLGNGNHTFQVKAADAAGNSDATPESFSWTVNLPVGGSIGDATAADFTAGTLDANIYVSQTADGEVILRPTAASEFEGTALPAGWFSTAWSAGGGSTVANGAVTVDGARSGTNGTYGNNRSLEFVATFTGAPWQEIGFGTDFSGTTRQMIFTTKEGNALYARFLNGSQNNQTLLSSSLIGSPHLYRIEWNASSIVYFVDGSQVASFARTISSQMRPLISDYDVGNGVLKVDWMRMSPYVSPGTFQSRIIDGGQSVNWGALTWTSSLPAGTSLIMSVRTGNTPTPDGTWSSYVTVPTSGDSVGTTARYLQYRAQLSTTANKSTSVLKDVTVQYTAP